jgi:hypothetical protein
MPCPVVTRPAPGTRVRTRGSRRVEAEAPWSITNEKKDQPKHKVMKPVLSAFECDSENFPKDDVKLNL